MSRIAYLVPERFHRSGTAAAFLGHFIFRVTESTSRVELVPRNDDCPKNAEPAHLAAKSASDAKAHQAVRVTYRHCRSLHTEVLANIDAMGRSVVVARLAEEHRRKPTLMEMLRKAGWV